MGGESRFYCIISRTFNKHGTVYKVDIKTGVLTIYIGNKLDVIVDHPNKKRRHGNVTWSRLREDITHDYYDQSIPVFTICFPEICAYSLTIPKY